MLYVFRPNAANVKLDTLSSQGIVNKAYCRPISVRLEQDHQGIWVPKALKEQVTSS